MMEGTSTAASALQKAAVSQREFAPNCLHSALSVSGMKEFLFHLYFPKCNCWQC